MDDYLKLIVFGSAGVGKTVLIGSAVEDHRLLPGIIFDMEGGLRSIRSKTNEIKMEGPPRKKVFTGQAKPEDKKLDVLRLRRWEEFTEAFAILNDPKDPSNIYKFCAVDSLTELNFMNLRQVVKERNPNEYVPERQDYGKSKAQMEVLFRGYRDLQMHVAFTALPDISKTDGETGIEKIMPMLNGKLATGLPGLTDYVLYMKAQKVGQEIRRLFVCQPDGRIDAKDRSEEGLLGATFNKVSMTALLDALGY